MVGGPGGVVEGRLVARSEMKDDKTGGSKAAGRMLPGRLSEEDEQAAKELSCMISELNEVRMRLDSVVRKIGDTAAEVLAEAGQVDNVTKVRLKMVDQLDRIREKLVLRARSLQHS